MKPDHSIKTSAKTKNLFTDEQVQQIGQEFGFRPDFRLDLRLEDAVFGAQSHRGSDPPPGDVRKLLEESRTKAEAMRDVLSRLGPDEWNLLYPVVSYAQLAEVSRVLSRLTLAADEAISSLENHPRTRRSDLAGRALIRDLHRIYCSGTGRNDLYSQSPSDSSYSGPFVSFVEHIAEIARFPMKNSFIGDTIKELKEGGELS